MHVRGHKTLSIYPAAFPESLARKKGRIVVVFGKHRHQTRFRVLEMTWGQSRLCYDPTCCLFYARCMGSMIVSPGLTHLRWNSFFDGT
jgi:hypothetical protein